MTISKSQTFNLGRNGAAWRKVRAQLLAMPGSDICQHPDCGLPIDMNAPPRHPDSWTADHIDPLSLGGDPLALSNLRPMHWKCNSRRGAVTKEQPQSRNW